jgi:general secretion pathway protein G
MSARVDSAAVTGFTLIEMLITLALVGLLAVVSLPLYEVTSTRMKEAELRQSLRIIRSGIDAYKAAVDAGTLAKQPGESGYPPSLDILTEPLEVANQSNAGFGGTDSPQRIVILRQLPRDPFAVDATLPAAQTWRMRSYGSRSDDPQLGADVYDVSSMSTRIGLDGTAYATW